jgi:hypothetical protein
MPWCKTITARANVSALGMTSATNASIIASAMTIIATASIRTRIKTEIETEIETETETVSEIDRETASASETGRDRETATGSENDRDHETATTVARGANRDILSFALLHFRRVVNQLLSRNLKALIFHSPAIVAAGGMHLTFNLSFTSKVALT